MANPAPTARVLRSTVATSDPLTSSKPENPFLTGRPPQGRPGPSRTLAQGGPPIAAASSASNDAFSSLRASTMTPDAIGGHWIRSRFEPVALTSNGGLRLGLRLAAMCRAAKTGAPPSDTIKPPVPSILPFTSAGKEAVSEAELSAVADAGAWGVVLDALGPHLPTSLDIASESTEPIGTMSPPPSFREAAAGRAALCVRALAQCGRPAAADRVLSWLLCGPAASVPDYARMMWGKGGGAAVGRTSRRASLFDDSKAATVERASHGAVGSVPLSLAQLHASLPLRSGRVDEALERNSALISAYCTLTDSEVTSIAQCAALPLHCSGDASDGEPLLTGLVAALVNGWRVAVEQYAVCLRASRRRAQDASGLCLSVARRLCLTAEGSPVPDSFPTTTALGGALRRALQGAWAEDKSCAVWEEHPMGTLPSFVALAGSESRHDAAMALSLKAAELLGATGDLDRAAGALVEAASLGGVPLVDVYERVFSVAGEAPGGDRELLDAWTGLGLGESPRTALAGGLVLCQLGTLSMGFGDPSFAGWSFGLAAHGCCSTTLTATDPEGDAKATAFDALQQSWWNVAGVLPAPGDEGGTASTSGGRQSLGSALRGIVTTAFLGATLSRLQQGHPQEVTDSLRGFLVAAPPVTATPEVLSTLGTLLDLCRAPKDAARERAAIRYVMSEFHQAHVPGV
jgi:hypothetical protein